MQTLAIIFSILFTIAFILCAYSSYAVKKTLQPKEKLCRKADKALEQKFLKQLAGRK